MLAKGEVGVGDVAEQQPPVRGLVRQPEARLVLGPQQERADVLLEGHAHDVLLLEQRGEFARVMTRT